MTKNTSPKTQTPKRSRKKKTTQTTTFSAAREKVTEGIKKHGKAQSTTANYDGQVRRGREWIEEFSVEESEAEARWKEGENAESNLSAEGEDQMPVGEESTMHPQFRQSLADKPIECTPLAIAMFMAHKCMTEHRQKATAIAIHAAFKRHYDQMEGDKYRGRWGYDHALKEWTGNPVQSATVEDMLEACKNKDGEGERRHSRAMSIEDMRKLYDQSKKKCPTLNPSQPFTEQKKDVGERCSYLFFNAFSTSAFTAWMRIGEVTSIQFKNLEFPQGRRPSEANKGNHYFKLNLRNRKNWQKREKNGEHQLNGHMYNIYPQPKTPEIDMYTHLLDWLDFYEGTLLGRPLADDDYIFPAIGSSGTTAQPSTPISADVAQKKIVQMAEQAEIEGAKYFTTHCFRRGGAQYRFMFAPIRERWTLARVRWWGGWATGEHRDTLIRYLLDELYTYEEDHSNALCPNAPPKDLGTSPEFELLENIQQNVNTQVSGLKTEIQECRSLFIQALTSMNHQTINNNSTLSLSSLSSCQFIPSVPTYPAPNNPETFNANPQPNLIPTWNQYCGGSEALSEFQVSSDTTSSSYQSSSQSHRPDFEEEDRVPIIPKLPQGRTAKAYKQVVRDWEYADPSRSLYYAMKDWKPEWHKRRELSQLYGQRQMVALEFIVHFRRDSASFEEAYPDYKRGFKPVMEAVRRAQQERGEREVRVSRRKC